MIFNRAIVAVAFLVAANTSLADGVMKGDAVAGEAEGECGAVDRQRIVTEIADAVAIAQQVLDGADVVFVTVGEHER